MRTVQVRTTGSEKFAVVGQPTKTTVLLTRAGAGGGPLGTSVVWEACAICFHELGGMAAGAISLGRCSRCGFVHYEEDALKYDEVTTEHKFNQVERGDNE